ncbi:acyl-CoA dehydrogenase family protein [Frankia sp. AgB1.9]|uniref:acyl-CoA dehydrogenase family protein n=1 Tax=unclassified Frankia TaxID=2632575 RepID=UPI00193268A4|nr:MULTISPECIES: acyl-CoA dehydrogenase family protein [unclassified Frankia]MBL7492162.1 acyl-CoA dehydrogenase family protein [Frankia sp. AgW1.1]MBL7547845.1 acyl-CoA dehydrogenase family protein [Frankia sp. AgB1.9]MBL7622029.1 acyl-CoA dehydrogenase family protein [Frankia sp. AgB1.8]
MAEKPFAFTEEQRELRRTVRAFLEHAAPEPEVRRLMETRAGYDPAVWAQLAGELDLVGLAIPEEFGGAGASFVEVAIVAEEMGRRLLCAPYLSTAVLAVGTLLRSGDAGAQKAWLPGIAAGETIATLAFAEENGRWDASGITAVAARSGDGWTLTGTKSYVLDGHTADLLLVAARTAAGVSLFAVPGDAVGLTRAPLATLDQTRRLARVELAGVPATLVGEDGAGWPVIEHVLNLAAVALAAEQAGGAEVALNMAVQYAKDRVQFGRQIGSFQAVKHRCADMLLEVESARSAAYYAAWCAAGATAGDESADELAKIAAVAKAYCSEAYTQVAADNIQVHGGIGFTWEHSAHLYFRRAKSDELLFGDPALWRDRLATSIGV